MKFLNFLINIIKFYNFFILSIYKFNKVINNYWLNELIYINNLELKIYIRL